MTKAELNEYVKCARDPVYFLNTYGYVYDIRKKQVDRLTCFDYQEDMVQKFNKNQNNIVLKSRQLGLSVITAGFVVWTLLFKIDQRILIVANDGAAAVRFLSTVKQFMDYLPKFFYNPEKDDDKNNEKFLSLKSGNWVKAVASSKQAGRGEALTMLILDEVAFIENADDIWMGAGLALTATKGKCIMISTPYGTGNLYHRTWVASKQPDSTFVGTTIHWTEHPVYSIGKEMRKDEFGRSYWWSPWYEGECERFNYDRIKIAQELDLSFEGSRALVIDSGILSRIKQDVLTKSTPICYYDHTLENADRFVNDIKTTFHVWEKPNPSGNYIVSCLPVGEKVLTQTGLKNIEDINLNERLYDETGNLTKIKNIQITPDFSGDVYKLKLSNVFRETSFTGNHPILSSINTQLKRNYNKSHELYRMNERYWDFDFKFNNAELLNTGDWIKYPNTYKSKCLTTKDINKQWLEFKDANRIDFKINNPLLNEEFWWFIGIWLAEGWTYQDPNHYQNVVYTCHNINEKEYINRICKLFKDYNRKVTCSNKNNNITMCQFNSTQLVEFLNKNFGKYAHLKKIPEWVKYLPENLKLKLVEGYLNGDGCQLVSRNEVKTSFVSVSLELLEGVQDILFSCGIISVLKRLRFKKNITKINNRLVETKETYELNLGHYDSIKFLNKLKIKHNYTYKNNRIIKDCFLSKDEKYIYFKIKKIEKNSYVGFVYNFETESHTFLCKNITTHNCDVGRGDGSDFSTIQIIDANELKQVAEYQGKIPPDLFAHMIYKVGKDYNDAYIVIEANSFGLATCLVLKNQLKYNANRIYHSKSVKKMVNHHWNVSVDENGEIPGFQTTTTTRPLIIASLITYMRDSKLEIRSKRLVEEFETFIYNGQKAEHAPGYHDDLIIALAIALYIRDTEFANVFVSKEFYKSMLDAFSHQTSTDRNPMNEVPKPIRTSNNQGIDDDLSWLLQ